MTTRLDAQQLALERQAHHEANQHFADELKQFPVNRQELDRLEHNLAVLALAVHMAATRPTEEIVEINDGTNWHKGIDLMADISLCHRSIPGGIEYAVVEYFPAQAVNEIWNRGGNATEVLHLFIREQRQALKIWEDDLTVQIKGFLSVKYPGRNLNHVAGNFMDRFMTEQAGRQF